MPEAMPKHCRLCLEVGHNTATCLRRLAADIELKEKELAYLRDEYTRRACVKEGIDKEDEKKRRTKQAATTKTPAASQSNEKHSKAGKMPDSDSTAEWESVPPTSGHRSK